MWWLHTQTYGFNGVAEGVGIRSRTERRSPHEGGAPPSEPPFESHQHLKVDSKTGGETFL